jgi:ribosomal protein S18 acetylase RimI-like enzyme
MAPAPDILVRAAEPKDVDAIVSFSAAMAWETELRRLDVERLRQGTVSLLQTATYGFFQVAEVLGGPSSPIVGQLMVTYEWSDWRNGVFWWIQSVYVDPLWRRQGVFRRMHDTMLAAAKARPDVCGVRLYVEQDNHIAQAAYRRVGLTPSCYVVYEQDFRLIHRAPFEDHPQQV